MVFKDKKLLIPYLLIVILSIIITFKWAPDDNYYRNTDSNKFYNQAKVVSEYGVFDGFEKLRVDFIEGVKRGGPRRNEYHHPLRFGRILMHAYALRYFPNYDSGKYLQLTGLFLLTLLIAHFLSRYYDDKIAFLTGILVVFSPLILAYAGRPLTEMQHYLVVIFLLFSFINFVKTENRKYAWYLILGVVFGIGLKETTILVYPFCIAGLFIYKIFLKSKIRWLDIGLCIVVPGIILLAIYAILYGGLSGVIEIAQYQSQKHFVDKHLTFFSESFKAGPWYQYFIDYFILSPVVSILFLVSVGYHLRNEKVDPIHIIFLIFFAYMFFVLSFLIRHVRYAMSLDFIYRFFAASFILALYRHKKFNLGMLKPVILVICVSGIIGLELKKFKNIFVDQGIARTFIPYLLQAEKFFNPDYYVYEHERKEERELKESDAYERLRKNKAKAEKEKNPKAYADLSRAYTNLKAYDEAINAANTALKLEEEDNKSYLYRLKAYIHNKKGDYEKAIIASKKALKLDPNNTKAGDELEIALRRKARREAKEKK